MQHFPELLGEASVFMQMLFLSSHFLSNFKVINSLQQTNIYFMLFAKAVLSSSALINDSEGNLPWRTEPRRKCYLATHNTWWHESTRGAGEEEEKERKREEWIISGNSDIPQQLLGKLMFSARTKGEKKMTKKLHLTEDRHFSGINLRARQSLVDFFSILGWIFKFKFCP